MDADASAAERDRFKVRAIVPAAGRGQRLGQDKALVDLGGRSAIDRLCSTLLAGGVHGITIVRARGAAPLDRTLGSLWTSGLVEVVVVDGTADMLASVRAGSDAQDAGDPFLVIPVDHALVAPHTVERVVRLLVTAQAAERHLAADGPKPPRVALPLSFDRPGHPAGFVASLRADLAHASTLRDIVRREPAAVAVVDDVWTRADLDHPEDLRRARAFLDEASSGVAAAMRRHRSCRAFTDDGIDDGLLERLVDTARSCSTSSFAQLYTLVAVRDPDRRARVAELCAGQSHVRDAPVFLAVCADLDRIARCCARAGLEPRVDSLEAFVQAAVDAALVGQNLQLAAEAEGLAGCMIGAARNEPVALAQVLELPPRAFVLYGLVLGWPRGERVLHGRMPLEGVLHHEVFDGGDERLDRVLAGADEGMRAWARRLNAVGGYGGKCVDETKGWSDRMARMWSGARGIKGRERLGGALRALGFGGVEGSESGDTDPAGTR
jgi:nitroreductase/CTP:molybdopterin cytidylyltransferase MocA